MTSPAASTNFQRLPVATRRRALLRSGRRVGTTTTVLFGLYFLLPFDGGRRDGAFLYLIGGAIVFVVTLVMQVRAIQQSDFPYLHAIEAVAVALPLLVVLSASVYVSMSGANPQHFSEPLSKSGAIYFSVTVLSTVGFGDIVPRSDFARLVVSAQMLLNLVLLGTIARMLVGAAQTRASQEPTTDHDVS